MAQGRPPAIPPEKHEEARRLFAVLTDVEVAARYGCGEKTAQTYRLRLAPDTVRPKKKGLAASTAETLAPLAGSETARLAPQSV